MNDSTSSEVTAHETPKDSQLPPGLDIELITAEEAGSVQTDFVNPDSEFQTASQGRPLAGTFRPGEPTGEELHNAIFNEPTEHIVELDGKVFKLVRLTQKHSLFYLSVIAPKIQSIVKTLVPIIKITAQSYQTLQYLAPGARAKLMEIAKGGDIGILRDTFNDIGIRDVSDAELDALIQAAIRDQGNNFLVAMFFIVGKPLGVRLSDDIEQANIESLILSLSEQIAELAFAALESCARKTKMEGVDAAWIREQIELIDTFECMEIVHKQYLIYKENAKLRFFLDQIMAPVRKNMPTETPMA